MSPRFPSGGMKVGEKILFVDDEPPVLEGFQRLLHQEFKVSVAQGGFQGLSAIQTNGPFAVVISDMRMPEMDGVEFLAQVRARAPYSVRMLLTGHADLDAAIAAVNRGNIFRFLTKPCKKEVLVAAIQSGIDQYRTAVAERELVKKGQALEQVRSDWDTTDDGQWENSLKTAILPGPSQAQAYLQSLVGTNRQCYVLMIKLSMLRTVEERYGEDAAEKYVMHAIEHLAASLHPDDRLFQWSRDAFMGVIQRQVSPAAVRMEVSRLSMASLQHIVEDRGRKIMVAISTTFDLLPVAQFSTVDEIMTAFKAKAVGVV